MSFDDQLRELCRSVMMGPEADPLTGTNDKGDATLWPFQKRSLAQLDDALAAGHRWVILCLPTGAGKTVVATNLTRKLADGGARVLFVVHRLTLGEQTSEEFAEQGLHHGLIIGGSNRTDHAVQVASAQSLRNVDVCDFDFVIIDECHRGEFKTLLERLPPTMRVLGLTATPARGDGSGLARYGWKHLIIGAPNSELLAGGFVVPPVVFVPNMQDLRAASVKKGDITEKSAAELMDSRVVKHIVHHWLDIAPGEATIAFCADINHAHSVAGEFAAMGVAAEAIDSEMPKGMRRAVMDRFKSGETKVLTNCSMLTEGYNLPNMTCVIILRPTLSKPLFIQMCGRGGRRHQGKTHYKLIDAAFACGLHWWPHADHEWALGTESAGRRSRSSAQIIKTCRKCFRAFAANLGACPNCGTGGEVKKMRYVDLRLEEVKDLPQAKKKPTPEERASDKWHPESAGRKELHFLGRKVFRLSPPSIFVWVNNHLSSYTSLWNRYRIAWKDYIDCFVFSRRKYEPPIQIATAQAEGSGGPQAARAVSGHTPAADSRGQFVIPGVEGAGGGR